MGQGDAAVLVVRAWVEAHPSSPLRVTVRSTADLGLGFRKQETFADIEAVTQAIRTWLKNIEESARSDRG
jgi:hypothetical protein